MGQPIQNWQKEKSSIEEDREKDAEEIAEAEEVEEAEGQEREVWFCMVQKAVYWKTLAIQPLFSLLTCCVKKLD